MNDVNEIRREQYKRRKEKILGYNLKWRTEHKDSVRNTRFKYKYKITLEERNTIEVKQNSKCAICGVHSSKEIRGLFIDHNHKTNQVRGLLCNSCNRGIGYFRDDKDIVEKARIYLHEHS